MSKTAKYHVPEVREPTRKIKTIEYGRGLAALFVVLFHDEGLTGKHLEGLGAGGWFFAGHSGVEYFFVLSGVIIFSVHRVDVGRVERLGTYGLKRIIRIFPIFWLVVIPIGLMYLSSHTAGADRDLTPGTFLLDVFLIPREGKLTLPPAWTLQHEIVFYAVFAMFIVNRIAGLTVFVFWQTACLVVFAFELIPTGYQNIQPIACLLGYENVGFLLGFLIVVVDERIVFRGRRSAKITGLIGGTALIFLFVSEGAIGGVLMPNAAAEAMTYIAVYTCVIVGLLAVSNVDRPVLDATFGRLGNASYVLYLIHEPVGSATMLFLNTPLIRPAVNAHSAYFICVVVAVAVAIVLHQTVEKPLMTLLRRRLLPSPRPFSESA